MSKYREHLLRAHGQLLALLEVENPSKDGETRQAVLETCALLDESIRLAREEV